MSEAERAPNGGRQGSLKQSEGHWRENIRDRWAELRAISVPPTG